MLQELKMKQRVELEKLKRENLEQYAIKGSEADWTNALSGKHSKSLISVKTGEKRPPEDNNVQEFEKKHVKKKKRHSSKL